MTTKFYRNSREKEQEYKDINHICSIIQEKKNIKIPTFAISKQINNISINTNLKKCEFENERELNLLLQNYSYNETKDNKINLIIKRKKLYSYIHLGFIYLLIGSILLFSQNILLVYVTSLLTSLINLIFALKFFFKVFN